MSNQASEWFVYDNRLYEGAMSYDDSALADVARIVDILSRGKSARVVEERAVREAVRAELRKHGVLA